MLVAIAILMTIGVYGLVAAIVKIDDAGLHLSKKPERRRARPGQAACWRSRRA